MRYVVGDDKVTIVIDDNSTSLFSCCCGFFVKNKKEDGNKDNTRIVQYNTDVRSVVNYSGLQLSTVR